MESFEITNDELFVFLINIGYDVDMNHIPDQHIDITEGGFMAPSESSIIGLPMEGWPSESFSAPRLSEDKTYYEIMLSESTGEDHKGKIWKIYPPNLPILKEVQTISSSVTSYLSGDEKDDLQGLASFCGLWIIEDHFDMNHDARRDFWAKNPAVDIYCKRISKMKGNTMNHLGSGVEFLRRKIGDSLRREVYGEFAQQVPNLINLGRAAQDYKEKAFPEKVTFLRLLDKEILVFMRYLQQALIPQ